MSHQIGWKGSEAERFWRKVRIADNGCWEWTAGKNGGGYGSFSLQGGQPLHLEAVTSKVNSLRGTSIFALNARKTHCSRDHPLSGDNLKIYRGERHCRACVKINNDYHNARRKTQ